MQVAFTTNAVASSPGVPIKSRRKSSIRRDGRFILQTSAMTWEILMFVLKEEGVPPSRYERDLKDATQIVDDCHFLKAVEMAKEATRVLLKENGDEMRQLSTVLNISDDHLYSSYQAMAQSALGSDVRWGRIVALMTFTGIVAVRLVDVGEVDKLESVLGWERTILIENCYDWITSCGGWVSQCTQLDNLHRLCMACVHLYFRRYLKYIYIHLHDHSDAMCMCMELSMSTR